MVLVTNDNDFTIQRRFKRTFFICRVGLFIDGKYHFYDSTMISEGGMLLKSSSPLKINHEIDVHFYLPNGEFVDAGGKVVYNLKESGAILVGVTFTALTAKHQQLIREYVQTH